MKPAILLTAICLLPSLAVAAGLAHSPTAIVYAGCQETADLAAPIVSTHSPRLPGRVIWSIFETKTEVRYHVLPDRTDFRTYDCVWVYAPQSRLKEILCQAVDRLAKSDPGCKRVAAPVKIERPQAVVQSQPMAVLPPDPQQPEPESPASEPPLPPEPEVQIQRRKPPDLP